MILAGARSVCCLLQQQKPSWSMSCARTSPSLAPVAQFGAETWRKHTPTPLSCFFCMVWGWFGSVPPLCTSPSPSPRAPAVSAIAWLESHYYSPSCCFYKNKSCLLFDSPAAPSTQGLQQELCCESIQLIQKLATGMNNSGCFLEGAGLLLCLQDTDTGPSL